MRRAITICSRLAAVSSTWTLLSLRQELSTLIRLPFKLISTTLGSSSSNSSLSVFQRLATKDVGHRRFTCQGVALPLSDLNLDKRIHCIVPERDDLLEEARVSERVWPAGVETTKRGELSVRFVHDDKVHAVHGGDGGRYPDGRAEESSLDDYSVLH